MKERQASECRRRKLCPDRLRFEHKWFGPGTNISHGKQLKKSVHELTAVGYACESERYDTRCTHAEVYG